MYGVILKMESWLLKIKKKVGLLFIFALFTPVGMVLAFVPKFYCLEFLW